MELDVQVHERHPNSEPRYHSMFYLATFGNVGNDVVRYALAGHEIAIVETQAEDDRVDVNCTNNHFVIHRSIADFLPSAAFKTNRKKKK